MHVVQVDLVAAIAYEQQALASYEAGHEQAAHQQLIESARALSAMSGAFGVLVPEPWAEGEFVRLLHAENPWHRLEREWSDVRYQESGLLARTSTGAIFVANLKRQIAAKQRMLAFVEAASKDHCTEAINLRGPITVNGVPQGHSELTVAVSCSEPIKEIVLGLDGVTFSKAESSQGTVKVSGDALEVDLNNVTYVSVTAEGNPDFASGDKLDGEIVPIAGDSAPPMDETM